ncbi:MAG: AbrB/MazE/SpoVT family DNA-binding domain-containing protein [Clostridiales bacterium]|jgi:AbrB family transcriptional regulator (stage V sporulation protein T)|nr:AbrB/MazE/SpoVT family DNA-binding domain-containing protein [Clostridiales bacterium]
MKATGIVRKIDNLGRVVIPKEIRSTMKIREGDPLEIYTDRNNEVIFKKYSLIGELGIFAEQYTESLAKVSQFPVCISDRDVLIACNGISNKNLIIGKRISKEIEDYIETKTLSIIKKEEKVPLLLEDNQKYKIAAIASIIFENEPIGSVLLLENSKNKKDVEESDMKLIEVASIFLSKVAN